jgi:16S rRNA (uracil1498-N3)-methyltransferase
MERCFIEALHAGLVEPAAEEAHHLLRVLRARPGDGVQLFDGRGNEVSAVVEDHSGSRVTLRTTGPVVVVPRQVPELVLIQALAKGDRMDWLIEKVTELGADTIRPVVTERVITRLRDGAAAGRRLERYQRVALAATRQCGRAWMPEVVRPGVLEDAVHAAGCDVLFVGALTGNPEPLAAAAGRAAGARRVGLVIGPEGDLTPGELQACLEAGAVPVTFGPRILRVETAAVYGISVLDGRLRGGGPSTPGG